MTVPTLSIVIPAFNEEVTLQASIPALRQYLGSIKATSEIVIVDDGSTDETARVVERFSATGSDLKLIRHVSSCGKGWAIRTGMLAASGSLIIFMDADLSYELGILPSFIEHLQKGADIAIGSRRHPASQVLGAPPLKRQIASRLFQWFVQMLFKIPTADTQCGLKGFRQAAARRLFSRQQSHSFAFDVEILLWARRWGYRVEVLPVALKGSASSSVRFWKHGPRVLLDLLKIRATAWKTLFFPEEIQKDKKEKQ